MIFTEGEREYLAEHPLGRLGTIGPDGGPQIHPVAFRLNADGTIDIGGPALARSQKFGNVRADPRVSFAVDDQAATPNALGQTGRGIEIRGAAETVGGETIRIHARRIIAWNIGEFGPLPPGREPHLQGYNSRDVSP
ncbi:MAG: PPOX class F420-dependent oxidoreductase [Actinobacteria bacterium]|nr:PPOX class F420-dependent oxidoreductase [Actinomycetota bacterium]